ncbi:uncharacterized protein LOC126095348 [Schistocerca cancellata]|uniref:uncharacterized protein LOC126095348 n=1 Tax=Schistocerca cancellata TaxID=274614 RepID=UPI002118B84F|nr:uncharacterized protein LOC126095348 [Schistocerca cancellata]
MPLLAVTTAAMQATPNVPLAAHAPPQHTVAVGQFCQFQLEQTTRLTQTVSKSVRAAATAPQAAGPRSSGSADLETVDWVPPVAGPPPLEPPTPPPPTSPEVTTLTGAMDSLAPTDSPMANPPIVDAAAVGGPLPSSAHFPRLCVERRAPAGRQTGARVEGQSNPGPITNGLTHTFSPSSS